jgi:hypothetical protein
MAQYSIITPNGKSLRKTLLVRKGSRDNEFVPVALFDYEGAAREAMIRLNDAFARESLTNVVGVRKHAKAAA